MENHPWKQQNEGLERDKSAPELKNREYKKLNLGHKKETSRP